MWHYTSRVDPKAQELGRHTSILRQRSVGEPVVRYLRCSLKACLDKPLAWRRKEREALDRDYLGIMISTKHTFFGTDNEHAPSLSYMQDSTRYAGVRVYAVLTGHVPSSAASRPHLLFLVRRHHDRTTRFSKYTADFVACDVPARLQQTLHFTAKNRRRNLYNQICNSLESFWTLNLSIRVTQLVRMPKHS